MSRDRTKNIIVQAVEELLMEKPLDGITITAITNLAKVSRQTFYFHFNNVFDVYKWAVSYNCEIMPDASKSSKA